MIGYHKKYKFKYIKIILGGEKNIIIHVSGSPGSGKTTIGNKLKKHFGDEIMVKDLDDLFTEFMKDNHDEFNPESYQEYIYDFIKNNNDKIIIFVGLNSEHITNGLYDIRATHKFFINLPTEITLKRHFDREINGWLNWMINRDKDILFDQLIRDQNNVITDLTTSLSKVLNISHQEKFISSFTDTYINEGYTFLNSDAIYDRILDIING